MRFIVSAAYAFAVFALVGCSSEEASTSALAAPSFSCETGIPADGRVVDVTGLDHKLYPAPDLNAEPIVNQKATAALGKTHYQTIDSSTRVQIQCESGAWVKVQLTEPEWLRHVSGWIESKHLLLPSQSGAVRTYTDSDIYWDKGTTPHKAAIIKAVNRVHQEDARCTGSLDPGTVALSPSKSKPGKPLFFVTCGSGYNVVNVYFALD